MSVRSRMLLLLLVCHVFAFPLARGGQSTAAVSVRQLPPGPQSSGEDVDDCRGQEAASKCVHGWCNQRRGVCVCHANFGGKRCSVLLGNEDTETPHGYQGNGMTELPHYVTSDSQSAGAPQQFPGGAVGGDADADAPSPSTLTKTEGTAKFNMTTGNYQTSGVSAAPPSADLLMISEKQGVRQEIAGTTVVPPAASESDQVHITEGDRANSKGAVSDTAFGQRAQLDEATKSGSSAAVQQKVDDVPKPWSVLNRAAELQSSLTHLFAASSSEGAATKSAVDTHDADAGFVSKEIGAVARGPAISSNRDSTRGSHSVAIAGTATGTFSPFRVGSTIPTKKLELDLVTAIHPHKHELGIATSVAKQASADNKRRTKASTSGRTPGGAATAQKGDLHEHLPSSAKARIDALFAKSDAAQMKDVARSSLKAGLESAARTSVAEAELLISDTKRQKYNPAQAGGRVAKRDGYASTKSKNGTKSTSGRAERSGTSTASAGGAAASPQVTTLDLKIEKLPRQVLNRPNPHKKKAKKLSFVQVQTEAGKKHIGSKTKQEEPMSAAWPVFGVALAPQQEQLLGLLTSQHEQTQADSEKQSNGAETSSQHRSQSVALTQVSSSSGPALAPATNNAAMISVRSARHGRGGLDDAFEAVPEQSWLMKNSMSLLQNEEANTFASLNARGQKGSSSTTAGAALVPCSGNGKLTTVTGPDGASTEVCTCDAKYTGKACDTPRCEKDCNLKGLCVGGMCICGPDTFGRACDFQRCPRDCNGFGYCNTEGKCECNPGYTGPDCSTLSQQGLVVTLNLQKARPRPSPTPLSLISTLRKLKSKPCPDACSHRGVCNVGTCECYPGYSGLSCQHACPNECSHNGHCMNGQCMCFEGFKGVDCAARSCCNGHGTCDQPGLCVCEAGYSGENCENRALAPPAPVLDVATCDPGCGVNGVCSNGNCVCKTGWIGASCSTPVASSCPDNCNGRGLCLNGKCSCNQGWQGEKCELQFLAAGAPAADAAGPGAGGGAGGGTSEAGPAAITGLGGPLAEVSDQVCGPDGGCSGHGRCDSSRGMCVCEMKWTGEFCQAPQCPGRYDETLRKWNACHGQGVCSEEGTCTCAAGFGGDDCSTHQCPYDCGSHGVCGSDATCLCDPGWAGANCRDPKCKNDCSSNGECVFAMQDSPGECRCKAGFAGDDCSTKSFETTLAQCPSGCSGNGLCLMGQCSCQPGFTGSICEVQECQDAKMMGPNCDLPRCPSDCSGNGACMNGRCTCWAEYLGNDCSIPSTCFEPCKSKCEVDSSSEACRFCVGQCSSLAAHPVLGTHSPFEDLQSSLLQEQPEKILQPMKSRRSADHEEVYARDVVYGM
ncbi:unnamed protein product [Amoebophrya sp. A120]|nr:unnamed protein product [Amoebophrya sp. A120]|eukprot:GSA120T00022633001.1